MKFRAKIFSDLPLRKRFLIGFILVLVFCSSYAQPAVQNIGTAIRQGDAKALSIFFDNQIVLTFSDKTTTYSKKQAEIIIQKFFSKVDPKNFLDVQRGGSAANNTKFILGNMVTNNGVYKVYMLFVFKNGNYVLRMIEFEK